MKEPLSIVDEIIKDNNRTAVDIYNASQPTAEVNTLDKLAATMECINHYLACEPSWLENINHVARKPLCRKENQ